MRFARTALCGVFLGSFTMLGGLAATAEDMTKGQMIQSLQGPTRGFAEPGASLNGAPPTVGSPPQPSASAPSHSDLVDQLRKTTNRQIMVEERDQVANEVKDKALPTIDVEVFFAYNSAAILPEALPKLITLGQALSDPKLKGSVFLIGGHTDAKGSDSYNLALSGHRAESVKQFLVQNFHIDPNNLYAMGFGEEQLKNPDDPFSAENRRVQIVNIAATGVARQ
jgi:outer membrane protein OmpA-like peptidoglycan-associated protein